MGNVDYYRLWHRTLQLSDRKRWSADVEAAFGHAHGLPFEQWWEVVKQEFVQLPREPVKKLATKDNARWYDEVWNDDELDDTIVVMVNLLEPKDAILKAMGKLLDLHHQGSRGRPKYEDFAEKWPLACRPNVPAITMALKVWERVQRNKRDERTEKHWEIAGALGINYKNSQAVDIDYDTQLVLSAQVSRYLRHARALIEGVERGVFPNKP